MMSLSANPWQWSLISTNCGFSMFDNVQTSATGSSKFTQVPLGCGQADEQSSAACAD